MLFCKVTLFFFDFARILNNLLRCYLKVAGKYTNRSIV